MSKTLITDASRQMELMGKIRKPIITPLINDFKNQNLNLENFIGHVFISGMIFQKNLSSKQKGSGK